MYSGDPDNAFLRFNYSNDDGNSYTAKSFIDWNTGGFFRQIDQASIKNSKASLKYLSKLINLEIDEYIGKSTTNGTPNDIALNANIAYKFFPQLVSTNSVGQVNGINYAGFSIVAIRAIQEQQEIIESQADEIEALNNKNQELEYRLTKLESMFENAFKK